MKNLIVVLFLFGVQLVYTQQTDIKKDPGYFDFSEFYSFKNGEPINEIYLEKDLLKMLTKLALKEENVSQISEDLKLVRLQEFSIDEEDIDNTLKAIETMDNNLIEKSWKGIIKLNRKENNVNVYIKPTQDEDYGGLVITAISGKGRVAFVNIVGNINMESISKFVKLFNLPQRDKE